jgi:fermentation-respiration switch protein FrsA (DUF1100 family)
VEVFLYFFLFLFIILAVPLTLAVLHGIRFYRIQPFLVYHPKEPFAVQSWEGDITHEDITYRTKDGLTIHAWYVPGDMNDMNDMNDNTVEGEKRRVVLFCHGNVGNVSQRIDSFLIFKELDLDTFIFDYRGYGLSQGNPTEKGTYLDCDGAWRYLTEEKKIKPEDIILFGRSLGGGIASYLAEKYNPGALIIESSFSSIPDMAKWRFPKLPVRWLLRYRYDSRKRLKHIHCPVMIIHSPEDEIIPFRQGQWLYEAANEPKTFLKIKGTHYHGFLKSGEMYVEGMREFIAGEFA